MKNYTTIPNTYTNILNSGDNYRYVALSFTPKKDGYTDCTFKQLGEYINKSNPESTETVKDFVKRLKIANLIRIDEVWIGDKRRNKYFIEKPTENFRIIKKELLVLDLPINQKGFMIQLFSLTINNSYECNFSIREIAKRIKCNRETITKYLAELVEKGYIIKTNSGYKLSSEFFSIGKSKHQKLREQQIAEIYEKYGSIDYFKKILDKANWNDVVYLDKYVQSMEGGYMNLKSDKQVINESIVM